MHALQQLITDRKERRIKQVEIAAFIGCSKSFLSRFEKGTIKQEGKIIEKYAEYLGYEIRLLKK